MSTRTGRVVVLNGASSAGKTTLAVGLAEARWAKGEPWIVVGIDDVNAKLPAPWFNLRCVPRRWRTKTKAKSGTKSEARKLGWLKDCHRQ